MAPFNLQLRSLETRLAPAGIVTSSVAGTTLTLTGTDEADFLTIRDDGAGVTIVAFGGTFIDDNQPQKTFAGPIDNIKIVGKGGDDEINLDDAVPLNLSGFLDIDLGGSSAGNGNLVDLITTDTINLGRLRLKGTDGRDTVNVEGTAITLGGNLNADFGNDAASLRVIGTTTINGNVLMKSGAGISTLVLDGVTVKKNLTVLTGDGTSDIQLIGFTSVEGNAVVRGGIGIDNVLLNGATFSGAAGLIVKGGKGDTSVRTESNSVTFNGGGLLVQSANDVAELVLDASLASPGVVTVRGREAVVAANTELSAGTFNVTGVVKAAVNLSTPSSGLDVVTHATISATNGHAIMFAEQGGVGIAVANGGINVNGNLTVRGTTDASLSLTSSGGTSVGGNLLISAKTQAATLFQTQGSFDVVGNLTVRGGATASASITPGFGSVQKNVLVKGGADLTFFASASTMTYGGNISVLGGNGVTILDMTSTTTTVAGNLTVNSGNGSDSITLNGITVNGNVNVKTKGGGDAITLDNRTTINGATTIDTGAGDDTLALGQATGLTFTALTLNKKATIKTGAGNDQLTLGRSLEAGGDAFSQATFAVPGSVIDGGTNLNLFDSEGGEHTGDPTLLNWTEPPELG